MDPHPPAPGLRRPRAHRYEVAPRNPWNPRNKGSVPAASTLLAAGTDPLNPWLPQTHPAEPPVTQSQTAHDGTTRHDATLKSLTLSTGELIPAFTPQRPSMEAHVPHAIDAIQIAAEPNNPAAI